MFMIEDRTSYMLYSSMNTFHVKSSGVDQLPCKEMGQQVKGSDNQMPMKSGRGLTGGESTPGVGGVNPTAQVDSTFSTEAQELWE